MCVDFLRMKRKGRKGFCISALFNEREGIG